MYIGVMVGTMEGVTASTISYVAAVVVTVDAVVVAMVLLATAIKSVDVTMRG